jgi:hypothetical protein
MPNYANGKIYKLTNSVDDEIYIGSTCGTLNLRKSKHKSRAKTRTNQPVYNHLNSVGWDNVRIILIQNIVCNNKNELLRCEQHFITLLKPSLNRQSAFTHCPHGRHHSKCKPCGGAGICSHGKIKSQCVPCGGSQICPHNKRKSTCKICGGASICKHNKRKNSCKICNIGKYKCDYCDVSFGGKSELKRHYTTSKHKKKYIQTFFEVFGEVLTTSEAENMNYV